MVHVACVIYVACDMTWRAMRCGDSYGVMYCTMTYGMANGVRAVLYGIPNDLLCVWVSPGGQVIGGVQTSFAA